MLSLVAKIAAIALLLVFYGTYFAKMLAQRHRGIRTDQLGRNASAKVRVQEIVLKIITFLVPAVEVYSIFCVPPVFPLAVQVAGFALCLAGDAVFVTAVAEMKDNWRAGIAEQDETELVTSGIYAFSRNPAFLAFDLVYAGLVLVFFNYLLLAVSLAAGVLFHLQILQEEKSLERGFGAAYASYRQRVRRYLGRRKNK